MKHKTPLLAALMLLLPAMGQAQIMSQDEILQTALLPGWRMEGGHHMAAVSMVLAPEWKTYWRAPGRAGIPPMFDWAGSQNVKSVQLHWPSPEVFHTNGLQTVGYHGRLTLPIEVTPVDATKPVRLQMRIEMGICKDICMPASVELGGDLVAPGAADKVIKAALKARPATAAEAGLKSISCDVAPIKDGMRVTARLALPRQTGVETVVFEDADPKIWVDEAVSTREAGTLVSVADFVASSGVPFALDRSGVTVTVLSAGGSVEIQGCPAP